MHAPEQIATSNLLEFAGLAGVQVPTLGIEQHLAEKLHAYTREYAGGRRSTRVKTFAPAAPVDPAAIPPTPRWWWTGSELRRAAKTCLRDVRTLIAPTAPAQDSSLSRCVVRPVAARPSSDSPQK